MHLTYPEILQTIGTLNGLVGSGLAVYGVFFAAKKVRQKIDDVHNTIKDQQRKDT